MTGADPRRKHLIPLARAVGWWAAAPAVAVVFFAFGFLTFARPGAGQESPRRAYGLEVDGHRWVEFGPEAQLAFLQGFLSGAAAAQAIEGAGGPRGQLDSLTAELAGLGVAQRLHFRFAPTVYHARLQDYYFYRDRRDRLVAAALLELNHRLLTENF